MSILINQIIFFHCRKISKRHSGGATREQQLDVHIDRGNRSGSQRYDRQNASTSCRYQASS